jgi:EmrB/QacA subfamily drug resistance transporter
MINRNRKSRSTIRPEVLVPSHPDSVPSRWRWLAFAAAITAAVMDLLDSTVAQVAAPAIRRDLGGSYAVIEWITAAYTLAMAAGLLTGGRLGDVFGRKRMLLIGIGGFVSASAACAIAASPGELIAARAAQGLAGAMMLPQVFGLIRDLFAEREMGTALGVFGSAMGLSAMLGPIASGGLIGLDVLGTGWRMIFLVNVPVGALALVVGGRLLPEPAATPAPRASLDVRGVLLAGAGMLLLVFPLVQGHALGWPAWIVGLMILSVPVLVLFVRGQLRQERRGASGLVAPSIFRRPAYSAGVLFSLVFVASLGGIVLIFNVFLQAGLGFTPWHAAVTTAPWAGAAFVGSGIGSVAMQKLGRRVLQAGLVIEAIGLLGLYAVLRSVGGHVGSLDLLLPMAIGGLGMGAVFVPLFDIVMAGVEPYEMGSASGVLQTVNSLAMSLGVAGIGAIFFGLIGPGRIGDFVGAAETTALVTTGLLAIAFVLAHKLPRHARELPATDASPAAAQSLAVAQAIPAQV